MKTNLKRLFKIGNYRRIKLFSIALFCALAVSAVSLPAAQAAEWYVDNGTVQNTRDGLDWDSAYETIQDALDDASFLPGDEIWVKAGTYPIASTITVTENAEIYGGFVGTETTRGERDWEANLTTLDGEDLIDHVIFINTGVTAATIDGFTITGGNAGISEPQTQPYDNHGGGIIIRFTDARVANCTFTGNNAEEYGGGIFLYYNDSTVINCTFYDNSALEGAGIYNRGDTGAISAPIVTNCLFYGNDAIDGGGIKNYYADASITNCTFSGNGSSDSMSHGGGIYNHYSDANIDNCILYGNNSNFGPEIFQYRWRELIRDNYVGGPSGDTVIEVSNFAGLFVGDTIYITDNSDPEPPESALVTNITTNNTPLATPYTNGDMTVVVDDATDFDAGETIFITNELVGTEVSTIASVTDNIITLDAAFTNDYAIAGTYVFQNTEITIDAAFDNNYDMADGANIYNELPLTVTYSDVLGGNWQDRIPDYENNIDDNPDFVSGGDYHLEIGSPCIDAGDNNVVPAGSTVDLDGIIRFIDDTGTTDTGNGTAPIVDMGAYEYHVSYTVNFVAGGGGSITGDNSQEVLPAGNCTQVTAVPTTGYQFVNWTGTGGFVTTTANPLTVTNVTSGMTITANFAINTYNVEFLISGNGSLTGSTFQTIAHGSDCTTVTANADTGYSFTNWTGDATGTNNSLTVTNVTSDMTITANFTTVLNTYNVNFLISGNGSLTGSTSQTITHGSDCTTVTVNADTGYSFTNWTGDDTGTDPALTVTNVTSNMTITANFTTVLNTYNVNFLISGNGSLTGTTSQTIAHGSDCTTVTANPTAGYSFTNWTGDATGTNNSLTVTNVTSDMTITANFTTVLNTYDVNFLISGNGTLTGSTSQTITHGSDCTAVTANPTAGYSFTDWTGDFTGTNNSLTVTNVTSDMTITANFTTVLNTYDVNFLISGNGTLTGSTTQTVTYGGNTTLVTANPEVGYHFVNWTGDFTGTNNSLTVTNVTSDMTITANFAINTYNVNFLISGNGTLTGSTAQTLTHGNDCTSVTATAITSYRFIEWTGTGGFVTTTTNPLTVTNVTSDMDITANFTTIPNQYLVTFQVNGNGSIDDPTTQPIIHGNYTTAVTATADTGNNFVNWTGTGGFVTTIDNPMIANVTNDMDITANFEIITFIIDVTSGANGSISPSGAVSVDYGENQTFAITPNGNFVVEDVLVDSVSVGAVTTYTFTNVTGNHTISATFASDGDSDGISDNEEDGHPVHPTSLITGDGNGDGVLDSIQDHVTSLLTQGGLDYVTLESAPGTILNNVEAIENPDLPNSPSGLDFTQGFFNFTITGITTPPGNATVTLYLPAGAAPTTYYRYGPTPANLTDHWYEFMFDGTTGAQISDNVITLNFVDGDRGDDDTTANGTIVDAGGPGSAAASSTVGGGGGSSGGGCFIATTSSGLSHIASVPVIIGLFIMVLLFATGRIVHGKRI